MSGLKSSEVEARLLHINDELTRLRMSYVLGYIDHRQYKTESDLLKADYLRTKREAEDEDLDFSEPDYTDYMEELDSE